jgi:hypothetical protein
LYAKACCGMANTAVVSTTATTIAAIDNVVFLWFISQKLSSIILYLRCFTATANNIREFINISSTNILIRNIIVTISAISIKENTTLSNIDMKSTTENPFYSGESRY